VGWGSPGWAGDDYMGGAVHISLWMVELQSQAGQRLGHSLL